MALLGGGGAADAAGQPGVSPFAGDRFAGNCSLAVTLIASAKPRLPFSLDELVAPGAPHMTPAARQVIAAVAAAQSALSLTLNTGPGPDTCSGHFVAGMRAPAPALACSTLAMSQPTAQALLKKGVDEVVCVAGWLATSTRAPRFDPKRFQYLVGIRSQVAVRAILECFGLLRKFEGVVVLCPNPHSIVSSGSAARETVRSTAFPLYSSIVREAALAEATGVLSDDVLAASLDWQYGYRGIDLFIELLEKRPFAFGQDLQKALIVAALCNVMPQSEAAAAFMAGIATSRRAADTGFGGPAAGAASFFYQLPSDLARALNEAPTFPPAAVVSSSSGQPSSSPSSSSSSSSSSGGGGGGGDGGSDDGGGGGEKRRREDNA